jgi:hypothetical protein
MPVPSLNVAVQDNTTKSKDSAVHRTFETTELLEKILHQLGYTGFASTLELYRGVSKTFRNTIDHSPILQSDLSLKPYRGDAE